MSKTPLKDAYNERLSKINKSMKFTDIKQLSIGDYVLINHTNNVKYTGFVKSIGTKNITIESPYGGYANSDYISIQELKFSKDNIKQFLKPKTKMSAKAKASKKATVKKVSNIKIGTGINDSKEFWRVTDGVKIAVYPKSKYTEKQALYSFKESILVKKKNTEKSIAKQTKKPSARQTKRALRPYRVEMWFDEKENALIERAAEAISTKDKTYTRKEFCEDLILHGSEQIVAKAKKK